MSDIGGHTLTQKLARSRWAALKSERLSWDSDWREISDYLLPRAGRFMTSDRNKGGRRNNNIKDSTATKAHGTCAAGMMAGMTSPARAWYRLTTSDPDLDESTNVKLWLADVRRLMLMVMHKSNTYRALHSIYEEVSGFGTGASILLSDFKDVIRHYPLTTGEYCIATSERGEVNTLYREFDMTVAGMVGKFSLKKVSDSVRTLYNSGKLDQWVTVIHAIEPRSDRDTRKRDAVNMAWSSVYFEAACKEDQFLSESGFKRFPAVCPRWKTRGGDIYGESPGLDTLGDIKQLQHQQLRKAQAIDYQTMPALQIPVSMKTNQLDTLPGGATYVDTSSPGGGIRTAFEVQLNIRDLAADMQEVRERINGNFYADLFLMLANGSNTSMTATEVAERHEEKLLMLGPVVERLGDELLSPLIEMTFDRLNEAGLIPPAPPELQGRELNVEFVSMLAQAQKAVDTNSIDRYLSTLGVVYQLKPDVLDKLDTDKLADEYADMLGIDPNLIVPGDRVALVRQQRAEAAQAQAQMQAAQQVATTARDLSSANTERPSALTNVIDMFSGYS